MRGRPAAAFVALVLSLAACGGETDAVTTSGLPEPTLPATTAPAGDTAAPSTSGATTTLAPPVTLATTTTVPETTTTTVTTLPEPEVFDPAAWVGLVYGAGRLEGVQELGGALIDFTPEPDVPIYAISQLRKDTQTMLVFNQAVGEQEDGSPIWLILDAVEVPPLGPDDGVSLQSCSFDGTPDQEIAAVTVQDVDKDVLDDVKEAWRANRATGLFEQVNPALVTCVNEASGI